MSRFVDRTTVRVDLGDGDWAEVRTRLSFGDRRALEGILLGQQITPQKDVPLHHREANLELLRLSIVAWGGPGFCDSAAHPHVGDCQPRPITADNVAELDDVGEQIMLEIRKVQVTHSADLKGTPSTSTSSKSPGGSVTSSSTTTADRPSPPDASATSATSPGGSTSSSSANDSAGPGTS